MFATYFKLLATIETRYQGSSVSCVILDLCATGAHDEVTDNVAAIIAKHRIGVESVHVEQ